MIPKKGTSSAKIIKKFLGKNPLKHLSVIN